MLNVCAPTIVQPGAFVLQSTAATAAAAGAPAITA